MLPLASSDNKMVVLGTALWGWGVDRATAYQMLDKFVLLGGRVVDTATNYPINKCSENFGLAVMWLADWLAINGQESLSVIVKVGGIDNMGSANVDLSPSNIRNSESFSRDKLGDALACIAVHWDNREENDADAIVETVNALVRIQEGGLSIGFSGIRRPDLYFKASPEHADKWWIQVKENVQSCATRLNYANHFPNAHYLAYSINMGGVKDEMYSESNSVILRGIKTPEKTIKCLSEFIQSDHGIQPAPKNFNELALLVAFLNSALSGVIIGARNKEQLESTIKFWNQLEVDSLASDVAKLSSILNYGIAF